MLCGRMLSIHIRNDTRRTSTRSSLPFYNQCLEDGLHSVNPVYRLVDSERAVAELSENAKRQEVQQVYQKITISKSNAKRQNIFDSFVSL